MRPPFWFPPPTVSHLLPLPPPSPCSKCLSKAGFVVELAQDGVEALEFLEKKKIESPGHPPVDIILLDLYMPRMNGKELLVRLKASPEVSIPSHSLLLSLIWLILFCALESHSPRPCARRVLCFCVLPCARECAYATAPFGALCVWLFCVCFRALMCAHTCVCVDLCACMSVCLPPL